MSFSVEAQPHFEQYNDPPFVANQKSHIQILKEKEKIILATIPNEVTKIYKMDLITETMCKKD